MFRLNHQRHQSRLIVSKLGGHLLQPVVVFLDNLFFLLGCQVLNSDFVDFFEDVHLEVFDSNSVLQSFDFLLGSQSRNFLGTLNVHRFSESSLLQ